MQVIHLATINTCEYDLKSRIKEALCKDEYFLQIRKVYNKSHQKKNMMAIKSLKKD
jgi:hypothetical protein